MISWNIISVISDGEEINILVGATSVLPRRSKKRDRAWNFLVLGREGGGADTSSSSIFERRLSLMLAKDKTVDFVFFERGQTSELCFVGLSDAAQWCF
jgi:hypothetical protein